MRKPVARERRHFRLRLVASHTRFETRGENQAARLRSVNQERSAIVMELLKRSPLTP